MKIEAGRARDGTAHLDGLIQHDDDELGEPKIVPPSALTAENEPLELADLLEGGGHGIHLFWWRENWSHGAGSLRSAVSKPPQE